MGIIKFLLIKKRRILISLIILCLLIIVALASWFVWKKHQTDLEYDSLLEYENMMSFVSADHPQTLITTEQFVENNNNIYGILASLKVVQHYVNKNELQRAVDHLQQDLTRLKDNSLKTIIGLRLARIQIQQNKIDQALKTLNLLKRGGGFACLISDVRGEALLNKGDRKGARCEWETCIKNKFISEAFSAFIQMKINNLSSLE